MDNYNQITFKDLWTVLKKNLVWILIAATVLGCACAVAAQVLIKNKYTCSLTCIMGDGILTSTEYQQLKRNAEIAKMTLKTTEVITKVTEHADIVVRRSDGTEVAAVSEMKKATSVSINTDRGSYTVSVTTEDPKVSFRMITSFRDLMPEIIEENRLYAARVAECSEKAPANPSNRNRAIKYGLVGFAAGAVLMYGIFLLRKITDVKIYSEEDLLEITDLPIIGLIPVYSAEETHQQTAVQSDKKEDVKDEKDL